MKKIGYIIAALLVFLTVGLAGIYLWGTVYFRSHFLPESYLNGFDVSYMDEEGAEALINRKVNTYVLAVDTINGGRETLESSQFDMKYQPFDQIHQLISNQDTSLWFIFGEEYEHIVEEAFTINPEKLRDAFESLDCIQNMTAPQDARIEENENGFYVVPETVGTQIDKEKAYLMIETAIMNGEASVDLEDCYLKPSITTEDGTLQEKCDFCNSLRDVIITYDFEDRTERIDYSVIREWLTDYSLDKGKVTEFVQGLAEKYDTAGSSRLFLTYDNRTVEVSGGDYGWKIDVEQESDALMEAITNGEIEVRKPVYSQEAAAREVNDIGYTYLEIDTANRQVIFYKDAEPVIQVTGEVGIGITSGCYVMDVLDDDASLISFGDFHLETLSSEISDNMFSEFLAQETSSDAVRIPEEQMQELKGFAAQGLPVIVY